jgi:hypothetical protein
MRYEDGVVGRKERREMMEQRRRRWGKRGFIYIYPSRQVMSECYLSVLTRLSLSNKREYAVNITLKQGKIRKSVLSQTTLSVESSISGGSIH